MQLLTEQLEFHLFCYPHLVGIFSKEVMAQLIHCGLTNFFVRAAPRQIDFLYFSGSLLGIVKHPNCCSVYHTV